MLAPNKTKQTKGATKGGVFDSVLSTDLIEELNNKRDKIFLSAGAHVKQKDEMIAFCNELTAMAKKHVEEGLPWTEQVITEVCDYSQNLGIPHFGSEKPGDTYYYSPLGVFIFGMVRLYHKTEDLVAQYYYKGDGKKGGNNVTSLLWNKFKIEQFDVKLERYGSLLE